MKRPTTFYSLLLITILLCFFGVVMVTSASSPIAASELHDSLYYLKRHLIGLAVGVVFLVIFMSIDYRKLRRLATVFFLGVIVLLAIIFIPGVGKEAGGAARWIDLGLFNLQPSELAKLAVVLYAAYFLSRKKKDYSRFSELIFPLFILVGLALALIIMQPDMGTTIIISFVLFILLFLGGINWLQLSVVGIAGLAAAFILIFTKAYRKARFFAFLNPEKDPLGSGFHIRQSLIALGSGNIYGKGLGKGLQKFFYLYAPHTDFIFAVIGEELGILGTVGLIIFYFLFAYLGIKISYRAPDRFGKLLGFGITSIIIFQAIINMAAVTGALPVTGIPLPLISYGSSSLVVTLAEIGILLNIASKGSLKTR